MLYPSVVPELNGSGPKVSGTWGQSAQIFFQLRADVAVTKCDSK